MSQNTAASFLTRTTADTDTLCLAMWCYSTQARALHGKDGSSGVVSRMIIKKMVAIYSVGPLNSRECKRTGVTTLVLCKSVDASTSDL